MKKAQEKKLKTENLLVTNKNRSSVLLWIMVMDMVDNENIWKDLFGLEINSKDIHYDHHIALYKALKRSDKFQALDVKQKMFVLDKQYHLYDSVRNAYNHDLPYPNDLASAAIPDSSTLSFKKVSKKEADRFTGLNHLYLFCSDLEKMPDQIRWQKNRAISRFK